MPDSKRNEILEAIRRIAEELGRAPSIAEFRKQAKISWHQVYKHFRGMRAAVRAAGLEPGPRGGPLNEKALVLDWARVVRELGRLPNRAEYTARGKHHAVTLHARLGWSQMAHRFVLLTREFHLEKEWGDVVETVCKRFPLLKRSIQQSAFSIQPERKDRVVGSSDHRAIWNAKPEPSPSAGNWGMRLGKVVTAALAVQILLAAQRSSDGPMARSTDDPIHCGLMTRSPDDPILFGPMAGSPDDPILYGEPLGLEAMAHAPTNEDGVVFLFGVVAAQLGFRVERIQRGFPDCEAKREILPGKWELVRIEFEYESRNFKEHRHDATRCEAIVCWIHNWAEVPEDLEVVELRKVVRGI